VSKLQQGSERGTTGAGVGGGGAKATKNEKP
jgi:hypothetical protein